MWRSIILYVRGCTVDGRWVGSKLGGQGIHFLQAGNYACVRPPCPQLAFMFHANAPRPLAPCLPPSPHPQAANAVGYGAPTTQAMLEATRVAPGAVDYFVELHIEQGEARGRACV